MGRKLKVLEQHFGADYTPVPTILLKGKWLEAAGFQIGEYVEVSIENDVITITKTTPPEEKLTLDEKIKSLDKKQLEKLSEFVDKL